MNCRREETQRWKGYLRRSRCSWHRLLDIVPICPLAPEREDARGETAVWVGPDIGKGDLLPPADRVP